jgi:hypothetical protein
MQLARFQVANYIGVVIIAPIMMNRFGGKQ